MAAKTPKSRRTKTVRQGSVSSKDGKAIKQEEATEFAATRPRTKSKIPKLSVRTTEIEQNDAMDTLLLFVKTYAKF